MTLEEARALVGGRVKPLGTYGVKEVRAKGGLEPRVVIVFRWIDGDDSVGWRQQAEALNQLDELRSECGYPVTHETEPMPNDV